MNQASSDVLLQAALEAARERSLRFLTGLQVPGSPRGVMRISPVHEAKAWPGVLLPGTYIATARNAGQAFQREFSVQQGQVVQVEVLRR